MYMQQQPTIAATNNTVYSMVKPEDTASAPTPHPNPNPRIATTTHLGATECGGHCDMSAAACCPRSPHKARSWACRKPLPIFREVYQDSRWHVPRYGGHESNRKQEDKELPR